MTLFSKYVERLPAVVQMQHNFADVISVEKKQKLPEHIHNYGVPIASLCCTRKTPVRYGYSTRSRKSVLRCSFNNIIFQFITTQIIY